MSRLDGPAHWQPTGWRRVAGLESAALAATRITGRPATRSVSAADGACTFDRIQTARPCSPEPRQIHGGGSANTTRLRGNPLPAGQAHVDVEDGFLDRAHRLTTAHHSPPRCWTLTFTRSGAMPVPDSAPPRPAQLAWPGLRQTVELHHREIKGLTDPARGLHAAKASPWAFKPSASASKPVSVLFARNMPDFGWWWFSWPESITHALRGIPG